MLVREFRSPGRTPDGSIKDVPGGSSFKRDQAPLATAVAEVKEEVGLVIDPQAVQLHEARQSAGTLSVHQIHAFSVALTAEEMAQLHAWEAANRVRGESAVGERTYVRIQTVRQVLADTSVDWTTVGIILSVLHQRLTTGLRTGRDNSRGSEP